jgi:hypothetical protein
MIGVQLEPSRQLSFADDANQLAKFIDNRKSTDSVTKQEFGNFPD